MLGGVSLPIHCFGDSHVCFFSGYERSEGGTPGVDDRLPFFRTYWLGPALAYNLSQFGTTTGAREKLLAALDNGSTPREPRPPVFRRDRLSRAPHGPGALAREVARRCRRGVRRKVCRRFRGGTPGRLLAYWMGSPSLGRERLDAPEHAVSPARYSGRADPSGEDVQCDVGRPSGVAGHTLRI